MKLLKIILIAQVKLKVIKSIYKELAEDELDHVEKLVDVGDKQEFVKDSKEAIIWEFEKAQILKKHNKLTAELSNIK